MAGKNGGSRGTPEKAAARPWQERFLDRLRKTPNVAAACRAASIGRTTAYRHRDEDAEFRREWMDALNEGIDALMEAAWGRAIGGDKPSDLLTIFLLKAHRPEVYRDKPSVHVHADSPDTLAAAIKAASDAMKGTVPE